MQITIEVNDAFAQQAQAAAQSPEAFAASILNARIRKVDLVRAAQPVVDAPPSGRATMLTRITTARQLKADKPGGPNPPIKIQPEPVPAGRVESADQDSTRARSGRAG